MIKKVWILIVTLQLSILIFQLRSHLPNFFENSSPQNSEQVLKDPFRHMSINSQDFPKRVKKLPNVTKKFTALKPKQVISKCGNLLKNGNWVKSNTNDISLNGDRNFTWNPSASCEYKVYEPLEARSCLSKHSNNVLFIGDSRSRQIFQSLKSLINQTKIATGTAFKVTDFKNKDRLQKHDEEDIHLAFLDVSKSHKCKKEIAVNSAIFGGNFPNLIIISSIILHPLVRSGLENTANITAYSITEAAQSNNDAFKTSCYPVLTAFANRGTTGCDRLIFKLMQIRTKFLYTDTISNMIVKIDNSHPVF